MSMKIALAGNPNSGKTTIFNALTGSSQYVGNWPGVTVEKKDGLLIGHNDIIIQDLPGIYSLSPYTLEEVVTRGYLVGDSPDAMINIVDAANLERNLYLTTQLMELGIPMVIALNMMDVVRKRGDTIDAALLSQRLGCPVVETSAAGAQSLQSSPSLQEAVNTAIELAKAKRPPQALVSFSRPVEDALAAIALQLEEKSSRWYAIKVFERDEKALEQLALPPAARQAVEKLTAACEQQLDDDSEGIVTNERYEYIARALEGAATRAARQGDLSTSDRIDSVVTNRLLALPIFAAVMFIIYYVSITTVGSALTDWVNEGVFGEGWRLFGVGTANYEADAACYEQAQFEIAAYLAAANEAGLETAAASDALAVDPRERTEADRQAIEDFARLANEMSLEAHLPPERQAGCNAVAAGNFYGDARLPEPAPAAYGLWIPGIPPLLEAALEAVNCAAWLKSLVLDGIVAGVGAVLGFVPQLMVLFIFLGILEDCGYMARVAFIMDRIFRRFGLSGKNVIPMLVSTGCGVPGVMATRTIENEADRRIGVITTTFMPCGAKLPIIALIAGALFGNSGWVAPLAYFAGIAAIVASGVILKKMRFFAGEPSPFVMELPAYHIPQAKSVLIHMWDRARSFIKKAFTIILLSTIVLWFLSSYDTTLHSCATADSILADVGRAIAPVFGPLGWGDQWEAAVGAVTGLIAKENVVATFGSLYAGLDEVSENGAELWSVVAERFTPLAAFSFMLFNLLCAPCFAAIGAIRRELGSVRLTLLAVGYQTALAYATAMVVYQLGVVLGGGSFGAPAAAALLALAAFCFLLLRPDPNRRIG